MYAIVELAPGQRGGFVARGGARELWRCKNHEVMLSGPSETGKTYAALNKLNALLWKYPGSQAAVVRKTRTSIYTSVLRTYKTVIGAAAKGGGSPVTFFGGEKPEWADYPNGSRVFFGGMDDPGKVLSSERDFIYVNQAEELTLADWETLTTRCTGRAANAPYSQIFGDCNPGAPTHWILHRDSLTLLESRHEDNPTLFGDDGAITDRGRRTLEILDNLTGTRRQRLRFGRWVQAEGVVYEEWDRAVHLWGDPLPAFKRYVASVDWGFTNPGVLLVFGIDGDGRMFLVREHYRSGQLIGWWAAKAKDVRAEFRPEAFVCDPAEPSFLEEFRAAGCNAVPGFNAIPPGIQAVKARLSRAADDRPRLYVAKGCLAERDETLASAKQPTSIVEEFDLYVWPKGQDGKPVKEKPVDKDNHGLDALRYAVAYVDRLGAEPKPTLTVARNPFAGYRG